MAYSGTQWLDARGYFEAGLSLSQIQERTGIARSSISKKSKSEQWQQGKNADYIEAKKLIVEKKSTENQHLLNIADEIVEERIRRERLVCGIQEKALAKADTMLDQIDSPTDLKTIVDAVDKAAITLKVADRHAPKIDVTQMQAVQASGTTKIEIIEDRKVSNG